MDYAQLAQLAQPRLMGDVGLGGGALAGLDYGRQEARQQGFLAKAAEQAQMEAEMKAAQAGEFKANAPMRDMERKKKMMEMTFATIAPYSNAWDAAKSAVEKQTIIDEIANDDTIPPQFRDKLRGAPSDKVDSLFKMVRNSQFNTPQYAQKTGIEQVKGEQKKELEGVKGQNAMDRKMLEVWGAKDRQEAMIMARKQLAEAAQAAKEGKPPSTDQLFASRVQQLYPDDPEAQANALLQFKTMSSLIPLDAKAAQAGALGLPIPAPAKPTVPKPTAPAAKKAELPNFQAGNKWNNKTITKVEKNKKTGEMRLTLEDGQTEIVKP